MNNFEIDKRAKELVDQYDGNAYNLARRIVLLETCGAADVRDLGTVPDGTTDCTEAFQNAADTNKMSISETHITYYPIALNDTEEGWSFKVSKHNGIETEGKPTLERFVYVACVTMTRHVAEGLYYAAWPDK